eukprot:963959-Rhodomonas_salina.1
MAPALSFHLDPVSDSDSDSDSDSGPPSSSAPLILPETPAHIQTAAPTPPPHPHSSPGPLPLRPFHPHPRRVGRRGRRRPQAWQRCEDAASQRERSSRAAHRLLPSPSPPHSSRLPTPCQPPAVREEAQGGQPRYEGDPELLCGVRRRRRGWKGREHAMEGERKERGAGGEEEEADTRERGRGGEGEGTVEGGGEWRRVEESGGEWRRVEE